MNYREIIGRCEKFPCICMRKPFLLLKGALSGLRQFLATERLLKMMRNTFYFTSKVLFVFRILNFLAWLLSCRETAWLER